MFRGKVDPAGAIVRFVADRMARALRSPVEPAAVEAGLARLPWVLVLDGLDEVPVSARRAEVLDAIRALLASPVSGMLHLVVATTRPQGYAGELGDFHTWKLLGLSRARALTYAARLIEARYPGQDTRQQEIAERLAWAWKEPASRRLMRTPLQVTVLSALVAQVGRAPTDRWRLFSDYYRVMYQREVERPNLMQAELLRSLRKQIDEIHRVAGLWLQTRSEHAGETDALLSEQELTRLIDTVLERNGHDDAEERRVLVQQLFESAVERLVFLVHAEEGKYGFEIRSLQELMAAEALLTGGDAEVTQRLRHIAALDAWRNVFLFAAGKCFADTWHLAPMIVQEICPWLNDGHEDPAVRSPLTGSEIALDLIEDGAARNQPKLARSLVALALRLLELPPSSIHSAACGGRRPRVRGSPATSPRSAPLARGARTAAIRVGHDRRACGRRSALGKGDGGQAVAERRAGEAGDRRGNEQSRGRRGLLATGADGGGARGFSARVHTTDNVQSRRGHATLLSGDRGARIPGSDVRIECPLLAGGEPTGLQISLNRHA